MNIEEIKQLIILLDQTSVTDLDFQKDNIKLSLHKNTNLQPQTTAPVAGPVAVAQESRSTAIDTDLTEILAPMVGTFYGAPSPEAAPFVKEGDHVKKGQVLCIVEAMKLMNEIKAEVDGTIAQIAVENEEPLEFGQVLFLIKED